MEKINKLCETLDTCNSNDIIPHIDELNRIVENEKMILNELLESLDISIESFKIPTKYKKLSIEDLEIQFNEIKDIKEKLTIYYTMSKKIANINDIIYTLEDLKWDK